MAKDIDSLIKDILEEEIVNIEYPPANELWGQIRSKFREERRKTLLMKLRPAFAACIIMAVISVLFINFQTPVMAFANRIIRSVEEFAGNTFKIHRRDVTQDVKGGVDIISNTDDPRIGEAQKKIHFKLLIPEYVPEDFKLNNVDVLNKNKEKEVVTFLYINTKDEGSRKSYEITQESFPGGIDNTINILDDTGTNIEHIKINGIECTLISYESTLNKLIWINEHIGYKIDGRVSKDEIIKIAESMK